MRRFKFIFFPSFFFCFLVSENIVSCGLFLEVALFFPCTLFMACIWLEVVSLALGLGEGGCWIAMIPFFSHLGISQNNTCRAMGRTML